MPSDSEIVVLRGGLSVHLAALRVLWDLEDRGIAARVDADGGLLLSPRGKLTEADDRAVRTYRDEIAALVRACEGVE